MESNKQYASIASMVSDIHKEEAAERDPYFGILIKTKENNDGSIEHAVLISNVLLCEILMKLNIFRYREGVLTSYKPLFVEDGVAQLVDLDFVRDRFEDFINEIPLNHILYKHKSKIIGEITHKVRINDNLIGRLRKDQDVIFNKDTETSCFFYYKNGYVEVTKNGGVLRAYSTLKGRMIWKEQILQRNFLIIKPTEWQAFDWYKFLFNISGASKEQERLQHLKQIVGYLLHAFFDGKLKCPIFTDSVLSAGSNGRSGKTLLMKATQYMLNAQKTSSVGKMINGKDFDFKDKFRYQELGEETRLVILNDIRAKFWFEGLFNDITEGTKRERKGENPTMVYTKFAITTNRTVQLDNDSDKDRAIEYELSGHYNARYQPTDDFGRWLFTTWTEREWACFDNCMVDCVKDFLTFGLPKQVKSINLERRKLLQETSIEFVEWLDYLIQEGTITLNPYETLAEIDNKKVIDALHWKNKDDLFAEYLKADSDKTGLKKAMFTIWVNKYVQYGTNVGAIELKKSGALQKWYFFAPENKIINQTPAEGEVQTTPF